MSLRIKIAICAMLCVCSCKDKAAPAAEPRANATSAEAQRLVETLAVTDAMTLQTPPAPDRKAIERAVERERAHGRKSSLGIKDIACNLDEDCTVGCYTALDCCSWGSCSRAMHKDTYAKIKEKCQSVSSDCQTYNLRKPKTRTEAACIKNKCSGYEVHYDTGIPVLSE
jgi:hypothetical protein